ncbi:uncharacterized protein LOC109140235 [Larimichthys crocea]|uniref:uncharacterized protein LOC109140235 n=1 Tax=Larimichthys crocea TaxID=215358 RepID=UPI000F5FC8E8|nr:uncharacterized protein LOC109140235 [Larimichthys crocea]
MKTALKEELMRGGECVLFGGGEKRSSCFTSEEEVRQLKTNRGLNMNVRRTVICFFILSGNTGLITEGITVITGKEGGNITHECKFFFSGSRRAFYKKNNLLIKTEKDKAQRDRYSIEYDPGTIVSSSVLYVSITNLIKSDSGRYRCVLKKSFFPESTEEFELRVEDAPTTLKPNRTPEPFPTSVPSTSTPTTTQSLTSSSGSSTPSSVSPKTTHQSQQQQTDAGQDTLLYVGLTLVIMIFILSAAVLIYCRKTASKPKGPPEETEYVNVTEIREEDRQSRSPPIEISTVNAHAKYTKPNAAEGTDDYSLVTAVSSQMETKDDSSKLIYSVVDFSNGAAASLNSAPRGDADNVIYSVPKVAANSDSRHVEQASPPLYSTVNLHQR